MKTINRRDFLEKIKSVLNIDTTFAQYGNIYASTDDENNFTQIEFIPQSKKYHYTIYAQTVVGGGFSKKQHEEIVCFLRGINTGRNIILDTQDFTTMI